MPLLIKLQNTIYFTNIYNYKIDFLNIYNYKIEFILQIYKITKYNLFFHT